MIYRICYVALIIMTDNNLFIDILNDELLDRSKATEDNIDYVTWDDIAIVLDRFRTPIGHDSDCGLHNEPAEKNTDCTCKVEVLNAI